MKTVRPLMFLSLAALVSCSPIPTSLQPAAHPAAVTDQSPPTLGPTFTPLPTPVENIATPTALYDPIELSGPDDLAYQEALANIPRYRQGEMQLTILDENGSPLPAYLVNYRQTSHDFLFGGVAEPFQAPLLKAAGINTMTVYLDWRWIQPDYQNYQLDFTNYWLGIDELGAGNIHLKTNNLLGMGDEMPPFWRNLAFAEFNGRVYDHISTTVQRFARSVDYWEAILEPNLVNHNSLGLTQDQYFEVISTSIQAIRENDPDALVEINFSYPCGGIDWLDNFLFVQELLDRQVDFDVIGLQFYYNAYIWAGNYQMTRMALSEMSACYDRYQTMLSPYGKEIVGSEFSVPSRAPAGQAGYWDIPWSEDTQAQYLVTAYTIFFAKPGNRGLIWWNSVDPSSFVYEGGLIGEDGTPKKSYYALQNLIESWTTTGEGTTDQQGELLFRGFGGEYEIEIIDPDTGESMTAQVHLAEQDFASQSIQFSPNNILLEKRSALADLIAYWELQAAPELAQAGNGYLALVDHHLENSEWALADQTASQALEELAIRSEVWVPVTKLIPAGYLGGGYTMENGSALIWSSTTLHLPYQFPEGTVTVEVKAHAQTEMGETATMVVGIGASYSEPWTVANPTPEIYSHTFLSTGEQQEFTIRFPYDGRVNESITNQGGDVGELKLYIDSVRFFIKTADPGELE